MVGFEGPTAFYNQYLTQASSTSQPDYFILTFSYTLQSNLVKLSTKN